MTLPWLRVPSDLTGREPAEQLAWLLLLARWHQGQTAPQAEIRQLTGWGAGKAVAFVALVQRWAAENGAALPPEQNRSKTGAKPE